MWNKFEGAVYKSPQVDSNSANNMETVVIHPSECKKYVVYEKKIENTLEDGEKSLRTR